MIIDMLVLCARRGMAVWIISSGIDAICEKTDNEEFLRPSALHQGMMCAGGIFLIQSARQPTSDFVGIPYCDNLRKPI